MTKSEYESLCTSVEDVFASLYLVDVGSLTAIQRKAHQEGLNAAYLAVIRLENSRFADLTEKAKKKLEPLAVSARGLQEQLAGLKKATQTLEIVSSAIDVLAGIAKLLK